MESDIFSSIEPRGIFRSAEIAGKAGEEIDDATGLQIRFSIVDSTWDNKQT
jgi:hypothetical protein